VNCLNKVELTDQRHEADIAAIAAAQGRAEKEQLLQDFVATAVGKQIVTWCYSPFITFGVSWKKEPKYNPADATTDWDQLPVVDNLLTRLASRDLTGNAAKDAVQSAFDTLNPSAAKILWLCLNKDLKAGVAHGSLGRVAPGMVPTFAVMRAAAFEQRHVKDFPVVAEPKLDGNRVTFISRDGSGGFFTRTGQVIASLDKMVPVTLDVLKNWHKDWLLSHDGFSKPLSVKNEIPDLMLDGEMMSVEGFDAVNGALNAKDDRTDGLSFHIFDCLTWEEFDATGAVEVSYIDRRKRVNGIVRYASGMGYAGIIKQTPITLARSHEQIQEIYAGHRAEGYEGTMIKAPGSFYEKRKSRSWLKIKNEDTEDLTVIGVFQGQADGKYANTVGGLIVDRNGVDVRVSGLSDDVRAEVWKLWLQTCQGDQSPDVGYEGVTMREASREPGPLLGRLIEVEFHEVTKDGSLRHPRFIRFRDDKLGEVEK
jgi:DNA ligase-1